MALTRDRNTFQILECSFFILSARSLLWGKTKAEFRQAG
jgi:hypothetical protein